MEGWRARLASAQVAFREDEEDDELEMQMALDQLQSFIDLEPTPKRRAGGSIFGRSPNIERARIAMDNQMYLDYFAEPPIWGPSFFRRRYRMRRSLFNTILETQAVGQNDAGCGLGCMQLHIYITFSRHAPTLTQLGAISLQCSHIMKCNFTS